MFLFCFFISWFLSTDQAIETELLERLKKGIYGDIYNYPELEWNKVLDEEKKLAEGVEEEEEEEVLLYKRALK